MAKSCQSGQKVPKMEKKGFTVFKLHAQRAWVRLNEKKKVHEKFFQNPLLWCLWTVLKQEKKISALEAYT